MKIYVLLSYIGTGKLGFITFFIVYTLCSMESRMDEEPQILDPGPVVQSLLTQQRYHRLEAIWNGDVKYLILTTTLIFTLSFTFS